MSKEPSSTKRTHKKYVAIPLILVFVLSSIAVLVVLMIRTVRSSVYSERKSMLGRLTESCAGVVNDSMRYDQYITDLITDNTVNALNNYDSLESFFAAVSTRASYSERLFFVVDDNGKYYSSDGRTGKITDVSQYTESSADKLSYISALPHLGASQEYLIFRNRFDTPQTIRAGRGEAKLLYCGVLFDITHLNEVISSKFAGETNSFIYDDTTGVMLYKNFGIRLLVDGFNLYPKFSLVKLNFDADADSLIKACRAHKTIVTSMTVDGEEYYFCSAPIETAKWSVAFVVQSKYMDEISGSSFRYVILYIALIAVILACAVIYLTVSTYRAAETAKALKETSVLNERLEQATRAKSDFLSNMSHDIRTPINGIMGMTVIAKNVPGNPQKTVECLDKIDGASQHLLSLINDVLDMSRIERGKTEIALKPIDIRTVTDNCLSIIRGQLSGRDLTVTGETVCAHPYVLGDDLHLRQIFINILGNAVKFTKDGGSVTFRTTERDVTDTSVVLVFEIEDTGIGMSKEFLPKIFDVFTQDESGARSTYKGTGLGMAITKQLTELMGGTVTVESEPGVGSKFTVAIPFAIDTASHGERAGDAAAAVNAGVEGVKILIAEDNELNMDIITELLTDAGAVITGVTDGMQALETFRSSAPGDYDVILMDVMMPVMNGLDATRAIRALPREDAQTLPILAMTANAFENDIRATHEAGMNAHLVKPINIEDVISAIAYYAKKQ